ncbi:MAG: FHA domain-containing protein [Deltaproteobacteria bacterium]|nr:FHA domain-containing protein [Deltaproteobacteria bacterium]
MFTVVVTEKGGARQVMKFDEEIISIGRVQGNEIVLPRGNVSKRHATLEHKNNKFTLTDLGSTNGTYVNGRRVNASMQVTVGDKIYVGDYIVDIQSREAFEKDDEETEKTLETPASKPPQKPPTPGIPRPPTVKPPRPRITISKESKKASDGDDSDASKKRPPRPPVVQTSLAKENKRSKSEPNTEEVELSAEDEVVEGSSTLYTLVETVLDHVDRQVKRFDRTRAPSVMDAGTAGKVRIVIGEFVDDYKERGKLPPSVSPDILKGKAFRAVVDLGPISGWLDDPDINIIRVTKPGTAHLLRGDEWSDASRGFLTEEGIAEAVHCLGAGLEEWNNGTTGISWFRLEEGYLVCTAISALGSVIVIDKTPARAPDDSAAAFPAPKGMEVIREAIESRAKIAVIGGAYPVRLSIVDSLLGLLPEDAFVVTVEDMPQKPAPVSRCVRLSVNRGNGDRDRGLSAVVSHAMGLEPDWLCVCGNSYRNVPDILSTAAGRLGVIAALPLGGVGQLERELTVTMAAAGSAVSVEDATLFLEESFDIIVVAGRGADGTAVVEEILACAVSKQGQWAPRTLFKRVQA